MSKRQKKSKTVLTLALPPEAAQKLLDGFKRKDPKLIKMLEGFGVEAIRPKGEK